jgi:hypothetical protein
MSDRGRPVLTIPQSGNNSLPHLPTYVEHGGEIACRHPADALDSRMFGFVVKANRKQLAAYCNRVYNAPTDDEWHWEPLCDEVLLNFVNIGKMASTDPLDQQLGGCKENEVAIWMPIVDRLHRKFAWGIPYMFVDQALALVGGREVYGFPKQLGKIDVPRRGVTKTPKHLTIDSVTVDRYVPTSMAEERRVLTVQRPGAQRPLDQAWNSFDEAVAQLTKIAVEDLEHDLRGDDPRVWLDRLLRDAARRAEDVPGDLRFFMHLLEENAPMLLLKQFRDAHVPGAACYQALVLVNMRVEKLRAGGMLPDDYKVEIKDLDGEPICRELGIANECTPRLSFWLDFDFLVDLGEILWEAPNT